MANTIYTEGYDNSVRFKLSINDIAISLSSITKIDAIVSGVETSSTNQAGDTIRWEQLDYEAGEIRCFFGNLPLYPGVHTCYFILYSVDYPNGLVFDAVTFPVKHITINA